MSIRNEYEAVRGSAGVIDLSARGKIRFDGADRHKWLQGQVSNDVLNLAAGRGQEACVLEVKGHIIAFLRLVNAGGYLLADVHPDFCASTIQRLDAYRIMEKVEMQDATRELGLIGLHGPAVYDLIAPRLAGWNAESEHDCVEREWDGAGWLVVGSRLTGEQGFEIYGPPDAIARFRQQLVEAGAMSIGLDTLNLLRVENLRPWQPSELNEKVFPHEAGIERRAVSFTKGCYVGQETVARIQSRGHVNRRLVGLTFTEAVEPGTSIVTAVEAREVGRVTSAIVSPRLGAIGLGFLRREVIDGATPLSARRGETTIGVSLR